MFDSVGSGTGGPVPRFRRSSAFREIAEAGAGALSADAQGEAAGRQPVQDVTQQRNRAPVEISREPCTVGVLSFARYELPAGVSLSAVLPALPDRCGMNVLHFDDGHRYVGQARDVLVRFSDIGDGGEIGSSRSSSGRLRRQSSTTWSDGPLRFCTSSIRRSRDLHQGN